VLQHHALEIVNPREIQLGVGLAEQPMVIPKALDLGILQLNSTLFQDRFE
jgi:hypothetical protein